MSINKFEIQNNQYSFPYHYLASINNNIPLIQKNINWGYEYLTYMTFVINEINKLNISNVLDVGCGDGYLLNNLKLDSQKYGIDLSSEAIKFAIAFSKDTVFEVKDIFEIKKKYELVTLIEVLEHIPHKVIPEFIKKILSLVDANGYFIISVPTTVVKTHNKHYRHYDEELLKQQLNLDSKFKLIKEFRIYKESYILKIIIKLLNNKFFSINSKFILKLFWKWHLKTNEIATQFDGKHIIQIYKRIQ